MRIASPLIAPPPRNPALAPKRFLHGAKGLFQPHTDEQKRQIMQDYCAQIKTEKVAAYCHYCLCGLKLGGAKAFHLAELLFEGADCYKFAETDLHG